LEGLFLIGALSVLDNGSLWSRELLVAHVLKKPLPAYASAFNLERYQDPVYQRLLDQWESLGSVINQEVLLHHKAIFYSVEYS